MVPGHPLNGGERAEGAWLTRLDLGMCIPGCLFEALSL